MNIRIHGRGGRQRLPRVIRNVHMTKLLPWVFALTFCAALQAAEPTVKFAGIEYHLASVEAGKSGAMTNEYVPGGETVDDWTSLIGVRQWPGVEKPEDVAGAWMKMVQPLLTKEAEVFRAETTANDFIVEAWLSAPDRSYIEINLHRFVAEPGTKGVKAYQFAIKIPMHDGKGDPSQFLKNRDACFAALARMKLPIVRRQP